MFKQVFKNILTSLRKACREVYGPRLQSLCVFGSVAAGTMRPDSDIDILLVCEPLPRGRTARMKEFARVDGICESVLEEARRAGVYTTFSPLIKTPDEVRQGSPVFLDMTDTAKILVDRGRFLERYLGWLKERLAGLERGA